MALRDIILGDFRQLKIKIEHLGIQGEPSRRVVASQLRGTRFDFVWQHDSL